MPSVPSPTSAGSWAALVTTPASPALELLQLQDKLHPYTPLRCSEFEWSLSDHSDKAWVSWLLHSIKHGISIGFNSHKPHLNHITLYLHTSTLILLALSCPRKLQLDVSLVPSLRSLLSTFRLQAWGLHPRRMASGASSFTFLLHIVSASTTGSQRRSFHSITLPLMILSGCSSCMALVVSWQKST